jgi:hypothetical protein
MTFNKKVMKKYTSIFSLPLQLAIVLLLGHPFQSIAQNMSANDSKGIIYDKEQVVDFRLHTYGWNVNYQIGKIKTYYKTTFWEVGLGEISHIKETRKNSDFAGLNPTAGFSSYIFGKQNNFFAMRGGTGVKRYYSEKASKNGVAVGLTYGGGVNLGVLKPYYLEISAGRDAGILQMKYSPATEREFLDQNPFRPVRGSAGLIRGIDELNFLPGIYGRAGVHVDWGAFDEYLKAVEAGIMLDIFPKKVPIMVNEENRPFFINFYVSAQLGKRR